MICVEKRCARCHTMKDAKCFEEDLDSEDMLSARCTECSEEVKTRTCRACSVCTGASHHWMADFDDGEWLYSPEPRPIWACKHCDFTMPMNPDVDEGGDEVEKLYDQFMNGPEKPEPDSRQVLLFPDSR